jgi:hypothetical protein
VHSERYAQTAENPNSFYLKLFKGRMGFEREREEDGKGRAKRGMGLEKSRKVGAHVSPVLKMKEENTQGRLGVGWSGKTGMRARAPL